MATYLGFSTVDLNQTVTEQRPGAFGGMGSLTVSPRVGRKFSLIDQKLVVRDLLNAFAIKQGDKVGQPTYGTTLWSYLFEPNTADVRSRIETEIRRVVGLDPRIVLNTVQVYGQENGFMVQLEVAFSPFNQAVTVDFFLNRYDGTIQQLSR